MTAHLTDDVLRGFAGGILAADALLAADDHLASCAQCRTRAATLGGTDGAVNALMAQLREPALHLSDDELEQFVRGALPPAASATAAEHVRECPTCGAHVEDLRAWATPPPRFRWGTLTAAAAIAMCVLVPAMLWYGTRGRPTTVDMLDGLATLPPGAQTQVRAALDSGVGGTPAFSSDIAASHEVLMGPRAEAAGEFECLAPVGTATISDRPVFEWRALPRTDGYLVTVFDEHSNVVERGSLVRGTKWTPADPLPRDRTYVWQVTAQRGSETITAPAAPAPAARFHVIDASSADTVQRVQSTYPHSHLLLGLVYMNAGIEEAATRELQQVPVDDPHADVARRSLERLRAQ